MRSRPWPLYRGVSKHAAAKSAKIQARRRQSGGLSPRKRPYPRNRRGYVAVSAAESEVISSLALLAGGGGES